MRNIWFIEGLFAGVVMLVRMLFFGILVSAATVSVYAENYQEQGVAKMNDAPRSFSLQNESLKKLQPKTLPKIDVERLQTEDFEHEKDIQHPGPYRFAVARDVAFTLDNSGTWQSLEDGRL